MHNLKDSYYGKKVLITGGGGFIGSNLAIKLVNLGAKVSIMDAKLPPYGYNPFNLSSISNKIEFDYADIRDLNAVRRNVQDKDVIFSLAAQVGEGFSEKNPELDKEINIFGHQNILDSCLKENSNSRLFFPGSRSQYGKTETKESILENHPMNPITPYAKNKTLGEKMYREAYQNHGLETVMFRISNPFGPRAPIKSPGYCIANWFIAKAIRGEEIPIYGEGNQLRDYIYIDDLTEAMAIAGIHKNAPGEVFNLGSGRIMEFKDMAQKIVDLSGNKESKLKFIEWPADAKNRESGHFVPDVNKIKNLLGWKPQYEIEEGIKKTIEYYRENLGHYIK
ncbi:NAD-dependent epimerase/dehydratase family protein [archaeon]|jgi:UDP-glucose 4-epimerase|nr:NAD-dependent epimerase/dehydratase family protein [archaeon]